MIQELDKKWVQMELIPLFVAAYGSQKAGYWQESIRSAAEKIKDLPIYEDFDSTIERFRLLLVNRDILTRAEMADFGWLRGRIEICIGVFVRHAIVHGPFRLHSLGSAPDPDHPRCKFTGEKQDAYIFGGRMSMRRPEHVKKGKSCRLQGYKQSKRESLEGPRQTLLDVGTKLSLNYKDNMRKYSTGEFIDRRTLPTDLQSQLRWEMSVNYGHTYDNVSFITEAYPHWDVHPMKGLFSVAPYTPKQDGVPAPLHCGCDQPYQHNNSFTPMPAPTCSRSYTPLHVNALVFQPGADAHHLPIGASEVPMVTASRATLKNPPHVGFKRRELIRKAISSMETVQL